MKVSIEEAEIIKNILSQYMKKNKVSQSKLEKDNILSAKTCQKILSGNFNALQKKTFDKISKLKNLDRKSSNKICLILNRTEQKIKSKNILKGREMNLNVKENGEIIIDAFEIFKAETEVFTKIARTNRILINISKYIAQEMIALETLNLDTAVKDVRIRIKNPAKTTMKLVDSLKNILAKLSDDIIYLEEEEKND